MTCVGGTAAATPEVCNEIARAKSKGIPVIACLGNLAASAGYELAGQHYVCVYMFSSACSFTAGISSTQHHVCTIIVCTDRVDT